MTRRKDKQDERQHTFYVPDGDAGEVWLVVPDEMSALEPSVWHNQQIADQYSEWVGEHAWPHVTPHPRRIKIATRMKNIG